MVCSLDLSGGALRHSITQAILATFCSKSINDMIYLPRQDTKLLPAMMYKHPYCCCFFFFFEKRSSCFVITLPSSKIVEHINPNCAFIYRVAERNMRFTLDTSSVLFEPFGFYFCFGAPTFHVHTYQGH